MAAAMALAAAGCSTVSDVWNNPTDYIPYFLQPYRSDVHQGNLVTSEMARSSATNSMPTDGTTSTICGAATARRSCAA